MYCIEYLANAETCVFQSDKVGVEGLGIKSTLVKENVCRF